ncbi:hypothetical protein CL633_04075 [bacterium]|nr:hypothetical protein [bacterium]|tara:strand:+ start:5891 stop:6949 length:1059 start_codon:yes stop_codon:yes gene_type:complete
MISQDQINELSRIWEIDKDTVLREYIQVVFLSIFYTHKQSEKNYFKGGTAIRLLFGGERFSADLDFSTKLSFSELKNLLYKTLKNINLIIPVISFKKINIGNKSLKAVLSYQSNAMQYPLTIDLDFSHREKPFTSEETILNSDFPINSRSVIRHLGWSEILSEKISAFVCRAKGRDVFDFWYLLDKGINIDWKMVNKKLKFYNKTANISTIINKIARFDDKKIKNDLEKFLPKHNRNLAVNVKKMLLDKLCSIKEFNIKDSQDLSYSRMPGGSFHKTEKLIYDLDKTKIILMTRENENKLRVDIITQDNGKRHGWIRVKAKAGIRKLDIIEKNKSKFKNKSYNYLINHKFSD